MSTFNNPLSAAVIGSPIKKGIVGIGSPVFESDFLTYLNLVSQTHNKLTVKSGHSHSETMNQGSFGFSGSFGFELYEKVDVSVSGYVGNAASVDKNKMNIDYFSMVIAGLETLDINNLTVNDLIEKLCLGAKQSLINVIKAYNSLPDSSGEDTIEKLVADTKNDELYKNWAKAKKDFFDSYGESFVAAIKWGAVGGATLEITSETETSNWKYGAKTDFKYSTLATSVNVQAAYDGSKATGNSNLTGSVNEIILGDAIKQSVIDMAKALREQLLSSAKQTFTGVIDFPNLKIDPVVPKAPDWTKEKEKEEAKKPNEKTATEELKKSVDKEKLKQLYLKMGVASLKNKTVLPQIKGNENYKKLADILDPTKSRLANVNPLVKKATEFSSSLFKKAMLSSRTANFSDSSKFIDQSNSRQSEDRTETEKTAVTRTAMAPNYTPLGLWLVNWADLFPWLAEMNYNGIPDASLTRVQTKATWRTMIQDFKTLNIIYNMAQAANITFTDDNKNQAKEIADQFATSIDTLYKTNLDQPSILKAMSKAYNGLQENAQKIYDKWCEVGLLRNAELGLGIMFENQDKKRYSPTNDDKIIWQSKEFQPGRTASVFACNKKVLPIIFPDGTIKAFCNEGILTYLKRTLVSANKSYSSANSYWVDPLPMTPEVQIMFIPTNKKPTLPSQWYDGNYMVKYIFNDSFKVDSNGTHLENMEFLPIPPHTSGGSVATSTGGAPITLVGQPTSGYFLIQLIPIPFSAAKGIEWQGSAAGAQNFFNSEEYQAHMQAIELDMETAALLSISPALKAIDDNYLEKVLSNLKLHSLYWGILPKDEDNSSSFTFWRDNISNDDDNED